MQLRPHLHVAVSNGRPVFLDVAADRYFCLGGELERKFVAWLDQPRLTPAPALIDAGLLVNGSRPLSIPPMDLPRSSAAEGAGVSPPPGAGWAHVAWAVARRRWEQKHLSLISQLERIGRRRLPAPSHSQPTVAAILASFHQHRLTVPIATCCLLDSLALLDLLGAHGHQVKLVIGVTLDPFLAHCWLQQDDLLLNDNLGHIAAFSPILVI